MDGTVPHSTPRWGRIITAQLRAVGYGIRSASVGAGLVVVALTAAAGVLAIMYGEETVATPKLGFLTALAACFLPVAVWRGEYRARRSYLAAMPVDWATLVLAKTAAGWVWLMVMTAAFLLWILAFVVVTGGEIGVNEMHVLARDLQQGELPDDVDAIARRWSTPIWQWAVVFTGPTATYLVGSAVVLAGSSTRRSLAGVAIISLFLILFRDEAVFSAAMQEHVERILNVVIDGRYGWGSLFAAIDTFEHPDAVGETVVVWRILPSFEKWILATLLWTGLALAGVLIVLRRDRRG